MSEGEELPAVERARWDAMKEAGRKATEDAIAGNHAKGVNSVQMRDGCLVEILPDGSYQAIPQSEQMSSDNRRC